MGDPQGVEVRHDLAGIPEGEPGMELQTIRRLGEAPPGGDVINDRLQDGWHRTRHHHLLHRHDGSDGSSVSSGGKARVTVVTATMCVGRLRITKSPSTPINPT